MASKYKSFIDFDRNDDIVVHPVIAALKASEPSDVKVTETFEDDHLPAVKAIITVAGVKYYVEDMWLSMIGLRMWFQAEVNGEARTKLAKRIVLDAKRLVKDHNRQIASAKGTA